MTRVRFISMVLAAALLAPATGSARDYQVDVEIDSLEDLYDLQAEMEAALIDEADKFGPDAYPVETFELAPKERNVEVGTCELIWVPYWVRPDGSRRRARRDRGHVLGARCAVLDQRRLAAGRDTDGRHPDAFRARARAD